MLGIHRHRIHVHVQYVGYMIHSCGIELCVELCFLPHLSLLLYMYIQVAIKIIDKTQLNPGSLQKVQTTIMYTLCTCCK